MEGMCPFCEELRCDIRHSFHGSVEGKFMVYHKYKAALVKESYRAFPDGSSNRAGVGTGKSHKLNYCPVCGKRIDIKAEGMKC